MEKKILLTLVALLFLYLSYPLIFPVAMGGVLAALVSPWANWLQARKIPNRWASVWLTLGITLMVIFPISLLISFVARAGIGQLQAWKVTPAGAEANLVDTIFALPPVHKLVSAVTEWLPVSLEDLKLSVHQLFLSVGAKIAELLAGLLGQIPGILLDLSLVVVSLYFFLVDRARILIWVRRHSFFKPRETEYLIHGLMGMCRSVILAAIVAGAAQAVVEGLAVALTGMPNVFLITSLVFFGSFVPLVGALPATLGVALQALVSGSQFAAGVLLVMAVIVGGIDNAVRPLFLRETAHIHPLLAFIAAIGGLGTFGFFGIFLGPILAGLLMMVLRMTASSSHFSSSASSKGSS